MEESRMPDVREVYEMVTKQKPPEPGALERQQKRQVRSARNEKFGAFAVAAAIGVAAVVLILANRGGQNVTTPLDVPEPTAQEVATGFLQAYGALDADRAITYLADDAFIAELTGGNGSLEEFRLLVSWLEAGGYNQVIDSCEEQGSSASGTRVHCTFDFHLFGSDQIGRGPFSGSSFDLYVRDGEIVRALQYWEIEEFSPQMWEPFADWVSTTYPEDAAVMYEDETYSLERRTEESIRLWERHVREYVEEVGP